MTMVLIWRTYYKFHGALENELGVPFQFPPRPTQPPEREMLEINHDPGEVGTGRAPRAPQGSKRMRVKGIERFPCGFEKQQAFIMLFELNYAVELPLVIWLLVSNITLLITFVPPR